MPNYFTIVPKKVFLWLPIFLLLSTQSFTQSNFATAPPAVPNLVRVEYYIDVDPGFGNAVAVPIVNGTNLANQSININPASVSIGVHRVGVRGMDANGVWSLESSCIFYKPYSNTSTNQPPPAIPNITNVEYYIDDDPGLGKGIPVSFTPGIDLADVAFNINPSLITQGTHMIVLRGKDANGAWSLNNSWMVNFSVPLPVSWLYFKGKKQGNDALLDWATTQEINAKQYVVERSTDGLNFTDIGYILTVGNNSNTTNNYSFSDVDAALLNAPVLYYRLRQIDKDGKFAYSILVIIKFEHNNSELLITAYPNPFGKNITLKILNVAATDINDQVWLCTLDGKILYQHKIPNQSSATILLDKLPQLTPGLYLLKANINGQIYTIKMVHL